ncbi:hypothetical protein CAEBREN_23539 [Caenorhabditis brenneri]|uniref:SPK domain-containing protein n=1 Tax=Caenorhabditis brenneri TaxID=135651 RepID=G0NFT0_CAEBE|nr:hypothetical protein CAEBREN_23539 [Caenorhabditis brenneri]
MFQSAGKLIKEFFANRGKPNNVNLSKRSKREHELWKFIDFVFEKCKNISSPLILAQFYDEYNALYSLTRNHSALHTRLRQNSLVRVDKKKRIIEYKSNDGSLHLHGKHDRNSKRLKLKRSTDSDGEDSEEEQNSDEDSDVCVVSDDKVYLDSSEDDKDSDEKETGDTSEKSAHVQDKMKRLSRRRSDSNKQMWKTKCKNISSPLIFAQFYDEYNALYRLTKSHSGLKTRIKVYCREIQNVKSLDTPTKVKQLFGLSGSLTENCLEELRQNAFVRVDELKRITEYQSNDGSLLLRGKHDLSSKSISKRRPLKRPIDSDGEDSEEDQSFDKDSDVCVVSDDEVCLDSSEDDEDSDEEETGDTSEKSVTVQDKKQKLSRRRISSSDDSDSNDHQSTSTVIQTSRRGRLSKNRDLDEHLSHDEVKESFLPEKAQATKNSSVSDANTPRRTNNKRKTIDTTAESSKRSKETTTSRADDLEDYDPNHLFNDSNSMANDGEHVVVNDREEARFDEEQVKVEVFRGALQDEVITIGDEDDDDIQEILPPPKRVNDVPPTDDVEIKKPVVPMTQKPEELVQVKEEVMTEEEDVKPTLSPNRAPILQILQGLHTLIVSLYHPSLETLQNELEERMKRFERSATSIPISQIVWTMELCFSKMTESSVRISFEGPQFINLRDFLCYLKSFYFESQDGRIEIRYG